MKERGLIYLCLQTYIYNQLSKSKVIPKKHLVALFGSRYHIPKCLRPLLIKELLNFNILKLTKSNLNYKVTKPILNPIDNLHILRAKLGLL